MSLRQHIIFVSSASDSPIKYEPSLVQSLFLHMLETGLQDEAVRAKLRPFLEKTTVSDEQLLEKINQVMSAEMERCNKMSSGGKKGWRVNQVGTSSVSSNPAPGQPGQTPQSESAKSVKKEAKPNSVVTALEAIQSYLSSLKQAFDKAHTFSERTANERYGSANQSQFRHRTRRACYSASVESCDHCFKCGSSDHCKRMQKRAWFGKREEAAPTGQGVAGKAMPHAGQFCGKTEGDTPFKQLSDCKAVRYCSKACQADDWKEHKTLCQAISTLADQNYRKDRERSQTFVSHLSPQEHAQVIRLVGRKCTVKCLLNGVETEALWDTGAQVSIIPSNWVRKFYPGTDVRNITELLGMGGLDLKTANGTDLPYKGWVELTFSLAEENSQRSLQVRFCCQRFT